MKDSDVNVFLGNEKKILEEHDGDDLTYSRMDDTHFFSYRYKANLVNMYLERQKNGGYLVEILHYPPNMGLVIIKENDHWLALDNFSKLLTKIEQEVLEETKEEIKVEFNYGDIVEFKDGGYGAIISEGFQDVKVYWFGTGREDWEDPQDLTLVRNALTYPTFGNGFVLEANEESLVKLSSIDRVYVEDNYVWAMSNDVPSLLFVGSYEQCREYVKHWVTCYDL